MLFNLAELIDLGNRFFATEAIFFTTNSDNFTGGQSRVALTLDHDF